MTLTAPAPRRVSRPSRAEPRAPKTLWVALDWIERHCIVPDGFRKGSTFKLYEYQGRYLANFYLVRGDAEWVPSNPVLGPAFVYRRALLVGPQKLGKDPLTAAHICVESVGPALFGGWAGKDDGYSCRDNGCRCGWEYAYDPGEPMGLAWPTPLIQITAFSEEQTENTYDALRPMIDDGPLHDLIPKTGEEFIRLPGGGRIDTVTSSAQSRLGQRITFVPQGEVGIWDPRNGMTKVADTQYRGLAGMGGRASLNTNAWDPAKRSVAQQQFESPSTDIYRQFAHPPANLSYGDRRERHKIHQAVYPPDVLRENGGHVDLDAIEAEAADLVARDKPQAMRFFGNIIVAGAGHAFDRLIWDPLAVKPPRVVAPKSLITIGFDGSRTQDATALVATDIETGYQWPLEVWQRPEDAETWEVPRDKVDAAIALAFATWEVWRMYADPPYWETSVSAWIGLYGKDRVIEWWTNRPKPMANALRGYKNAMAAGELSHCATSDQWCRTFSDHIGNAVKRETGFRDESGNLWIIEKDRPASPAKIDTAMAGCLSWEARNDAIATGALSVREPLAPNFF